MGWKGTLRSIQAAARQAQRDAERRQRDLERLAREQEREDELAEAAYQVEVYENEIDSLTSLHKETPQLVDWEFLASQDPAALHRRVVDAKAADHHYAPTFWDRLLRRTDAKKRDLRDAREDAEKDHCLYDLARRVTSGETLAFTEAVTFFNLFTEVSHLGSAINLKIDDPRIAIAQLTALGKESLPHESQTLLTSGKLSTKALTKSRLNELYQEHLASALLRVANDLFATLPIEQLIATTIDDLLNTKTGHLETHPVLSVAFMRETMETLNLENVNPVDCLHNFLHRMDFKKTRGFGAIEALRAEDLGKRDTPGATH